MNVMQRMVKGLKRGVSRCFVHTGMIPSWYVDTIILLYDGYHNLSLLRGVLAQHYNRDYSIPLDVQTSSLFFPLWSSLFEGDHYCDHFVYFLQQSLFDIKLNILFKCIFNILQI